MTKIELQAFHNMATGFAKHNDLPVAFVKMAMNHVKKTGKITANQLECMMFGWKACKAVVESILQDKIEEMRR